MALLIHIAPAAEAAPVSSPERRGHFFSDHFSMWIRPSWMASVVLAIFQQFAGGCLRARRGTRETRSQRLCVVRGRC
jgi:hypothetical protein